ncbi:MAG: GNAT family N-acetyltransferase [Cyanobacteria bacterium J06555_12]
MDIPTIETERLRLRGWREEDLSAYAQLNSNQEFMKYIGAGIPLTREESWKSMACLTGHWHLKGYGLWVVELKDTSQFIGRVGLYNPEGWPTVEIGWGLSPEHWGQGFAIEAATAALHWAFSELEVSSLISIIHPENAASIKIARRLGESYDRNEVVGSIECSIYKISRQEYESLYHQDSAKP